MLEGQTSPPHQGKMLCPRMADCVQGIWRTWPSLLLPPSGFNSSFTCNHRRNQVLRMTNIGSKSQTSYILKEKWWTTQEVSPLSNSRNDIERTLSVPWFRLLCNDYLPRNKRCTGNFLGAPHLILLTAFRGMSGYILYIRHLWIREVNWHSKHQVSKLWGWGHDSGILTPNQCP